ncbi:hypothetical protein [Ruminococcus gauvreauii]|uniref:hypothetical protein n=1 Tax=Ruminococcus gauvreauii TaxID=438033 RepID=UPI003983E759
MTADVTAENKIEVEKGAVLLTYTEMDAAPGMYLNFSEVKDAEGGTAVKAGTYEGSITFEGAIMETP